MSYMLGRDAYTHELFYYGRRGEAALKATLPELPSEADFEHVNGENCREVLAEWERKLGKEIDLPDALRECLADDKSALGTLREMVPEEKIITVRT